LFAAAVARFLVADDGSGSRWTDYRAARIGASFTLVMVVVALLLLDAFDPNYEANPVVVAALLGTIMTLLGIEVRSITGGNGK
jgi:hypothetical protein